MFTISIVRIIAPKKSTKLEFVIGFSMIRSMQVPPPLLGKPRSQPAVSTLGPLYFMIKSTSGGDILNNSVENRAKHPGASPSLHVCANLTRGHRWVGADRVVTQLTVL